MCFRYNTDNSPHLRAAFALDRALQSFSLSLANGELEQRFGCSPHIGNEEDLRRVMHAVNEVVLKPFHFESWFIMEINHLMEQWRQQICSTERKQSPHHHLTTADERKELVYQMVGTSIRV